MYLSTESHCPRRRTGRCSFWVCREKPYTGLIVSPDLCTPAALRHNAGNRSPANVKLTTAAGRRAYERSAMIHEVLSSDVDLVKGMINSAHSDAEILAQLSSRGLDPGQAAVLLDDLRHGRKPNVGMPFAPVAAHPHATRPARTRREHKTPNWASRPEGGHKRTHRHRGTPWWFWLMVIVFILAIGYAFFEMGADVSDSTVSKIKHEIPPPPGK